MSWDANGNLTQTDFSSTYAYAYPTSVTTAVPDPTGVHGSNSAFTTSITYDYNTGLPLTTTDANGQTATMEYDDPLLRPTKVTAPNGQQTITEYGVPDQYGILQANQRFVHVRTQLDNDDHWKEAYTWADGLGRNIKTQAIDDVSGDVFSLTCYDNMGRVAKASNPFRGFANQDCSTANGSNDIYWTTNTFDTAGRPWKVTTPDGAVVETNYSLATSGSQIGTAVTVTDQAGKLRRSITNALGQLIRVDEPDDSSPTGALGTISSPNQATYYGYDLLNNLTSVNQGVQTRTFAYNSLSRLLSATNPESGTINYGYDSNGNLTTKTDARNITTTYAYDALNRVVTRSYSDSTPAVSYYYDNLTNAKGKLTKVSSSVSTTEYTAFDILGHVTAAKQTTDGGDTNGYTTSYTYTLAGALDTETYPSGRVVKNVLDNNGDLETVQSKKNSNFGFFDYAKNFTYNPAGAVTSMQLGNGHWESTQFNSRLQPTEIALGIVPNGTDLLKLDYSYGSSANNGNVLTQTITVPTVGQNTGFVAVQTYQYDSLNRLKDATENVTPTGGSQSQSWRQAFTFDRYGNRNFDETNTTTLQKNCGSSPNFVVCTADKKIYDPAVNVNNNRLSTNDDYAFDNSGNTTGDAQGRTFVYDAENKQTSVSDGNGLIGQYFYDGDGKRVKKYVPDTGEVTVFVYDASGKSVAEYSTIVATVQDAKVNYLTADHLGSPRINTDQNGSVTARHDYHPFGEEIDGTGGRTAGLNYGDDSVRKQFTSYERDKETNLDFAQARYHDFTIGRFTSPDPISGKLADPQTLNKFIYVRNNPLIFIDPTGQELDINGDGADDLVNELSRSTGYALHRCGKDDKFKGCGKEGQIVIDSSQKRQVGKGISDKLAVKLKQVIDLTDDKGNSLTVGINTIKDKGGEGIFIDSFKTRTVDVGDLQKIASFEGGKNFVAGQLGHILDEYSQAEVMKANNPSFQEMVGGNPATHDGALQFESDVLSELEGDKFEPRRDITSGNTTFFLYNGGKNRVTYTVNVARTAEGKIINNIETVVRTSVPR